MIIISDIDLFMMMKRYGNSLLMMTILLVLICGNMCAHIDNMPSISDMSVIIQMRVCVMVLLTDDDIDTLMTLKWW